MGRFVRFEGSTKKRAANRREPAYTLKDLAEKSGVPVSTIRSRFSTKEAERAGIKIPEHVNSYKNKRVYALSALIEWHNKWQERVGGALL